MMTYDGIDCKGKHYKIIEPNKYQEKYVDKQYQQLIAKTPVIITDEGVKNPTGYKSWWLFECNSCGNKICKQFPCVAINQKAPDCGCGRKKATSDSYIGKTYNYLTVIEKDEDYKKEHNIKPGGNSYYKCKCVCGNFKTVRITSLTSGAIKSCGCLKKEQDEINLVHGYNLIDLTGQKFGFLTVLERDNKIKTKDGDCLWICQCDCGTIKSIRSSCLRNGTTISCGCFKESRGEYFIRQILEEHNIPFKQNSRYFKDLITFHGGVGKYDFIIFNDKNEPIRLIEYDGEQHFRPVEFFGGEEEFNERAYNDDLKNTYAKEHNIPLIRIPYTAIKEITYENLFNDKFLI